MTRVECPKCHFINQAGQAACSRCRSPLPQVKLGGTPNTPQRATPAQAAPITVRRGQVVAGRYAVLEMIGRGGMGCIYKVLDTTLNDEVALKVLQPQFVRDKLVVERFLNEARIARQLSHPNIVRVHDIGIADDIMYISMEYVRGRSLRGLLDKLPPGQRLPIKDTLRILDQLCASLEYAHQYTVHRDIKPENVMIAEDGSVKLMDFGISKLMTSTGLTATSVVMGTPHYMSPEQLKDSHAVDARADVYSIGVMLYEITTGNFPTGVPKPASQLMRDVPPALDPIIAKCLEPDPANRYASATELRNALRPILTLVESGTELRAAPVRRGGPAAGARWRRAAGAAAVALVLTGTVLGVWKLEQRRRAAAAIPRVEPGPAPPETSPGPVKTAGTEQPFDTIARWINAAQLRAQMAGDFPERKTLLDAAKERWDLAQQAKSHEEAGAVELGWQALQYYLAVIGWPRDVDMVFVPPGNVTLAGGGGQMAADGFFMEKRKVSVADFRDFCQSTQPPWRAFQPVDLQAQGALPAVNCRFYDAQAYAASRGSLLPTETQWMRAVHWAYAAYGQPQKSQGVRETQRLSLSPASQRGDIADSDRTLRSREAAPFTCFGMTDGIAEWTRTPFESASVQPSKGSPAQTGPWFGSRIVVMRGTMGESGSQGPRTQREPKFFQELAPDLGFRCIRELPNTPEAIEAFLYS